MGGGLLIREGRGPILIKGRREREWGEGSYYKGRE